MIGHVFASSGATLLMLAPSAERPDEYILIAKYESGFAVANILAADLGKIGGPTSWLRASYCDHGTEDEKRWAAAVVFADLTLGETIQAALTDDALTERLNTLAAAIEHAEDFVSHRAHLASA